MRIHIVSAVLAFAITIPAAAAVRYEFRQISRSDTEAKANEIVGRVVLEGSRRRVDYLERLNTPARSSLITDGARHSIILNHVAGTYVETDPTAALLTAMGTSQVQVSNVKSETVKLDDRPMIAGVATRHYRINVSYDVSYVVAGISLKQTIQTLIEQWTTDAFAAEISRSEVSSSLSTGDGAVDKMLDDQMRKIEGLPLRQLVTVTTRTHNTNGLPGTKLNPRPSKSQRSEFLVTSIGSAVVPESTFSIPPQFKRIDSSGAPAESAIKVLELQPVDQ